MTNLLFKNVLKVTWQWSDECEVNSRGMGDDNKERRAWDYVTARFMITMMEVAKFKALPISIIIIIIFLFNFLCAFDFQSKRQTMLGASCANAARNWNFRLTHHCQQPHLIHTDAKKRRRNLCLGLLRVLSISAKPFFSRSHKLSCFFFFFF